MSDRQTLTPATGAAFAAHLAETFHRLRSEAQAVPDGSPIPRKLHERALACMATFADFMAHQAGAVAVVPPPADASSAARGDASEPSLADVSSAAGGDASEASLAAEVHSPEAG